MGSLTEPMLKEFRIEAATTKRALDRIPADKLKWRPHTKSMTVGQLAIHIALVPGIFARLIQADSFDVANANFAPPIPHNMEEVHAIFADSVRAVEDCLANMTDEKARGTWRLHRGEKQLSAEPRISVMRSLMLNHWYHHRGQLSVYLRLLDVPVPVTYGPSADESPFT